MPDEAVACPDCGGLVAAPLWPLHELNCPAHTPVPATPEAVQEAMAAAMLDDLCRWLREQGADHSALFEEAKMAMGRGEADHLAAAVVVALVARLEKERA